MKHGSTISLFWGGALCVWRETSEMSKIWVKRGWSHSRMLCPGRDRTMTITRVSQCLVWEEGVTTTTLSGHGGRSFTLTVSCRDETKMWVFTHLFHLQIYVWGRSLNVALMVSQWWLSSVTASSASSRLSPEMSDVSRVPSHQLSYDREDSCGLVSLRLAIWTQTKSPCPLMH